MALGHLGPAPWILAFQGMHLERQAGIAFQANTVERGLPLQNCRICTPVRVIEHNARSDP